MGKKRFKTLTDDDINLIKYTYNNRGDSSWESKAFELGKHFGVSERTIRKWVSEKLKLKDKKDSESEDLKTAKGRVFDKTKSKFLITYAQNNTPVHLEFFTKMQGYAKKHDADIHVIAGRYSNPTKLDADSGEYWDARVTPYLDAARHDIHKYVSIMSDVKVQPTAVNPMTGLHGLSGVNSCVFGHPKVQMEMIPVLENEKPKMMLTTGACTIPNYTDSKAGKKGEFHHVFGFVIVEIKDDDTFYIRQVTADENGDFKDLIYDVSFEGQEENIIFEGLSDKTKWLAMHCGSKPVVLNGEVKIKKIKKIGACILGDLHYGHHDQEVLDKTHEMMSIIKPKNVVLHDVFDGYSISHHTMKDPFIQYGKEMNNTNDLKKEVDELMEGLEKFDQYKNVIIVRSNHDDFLDRWLKNGDWKKQPTYKNSPLYMEYSAILLNQYAQSDTNVKGVIPELINRRFPKFKTLGRDEGYKVENIELGVHGDQGPNGSRGSLLGYRKLNTKIVVGHYHSPQRKDNSLSVGTTTKMRVGYNQGPSSWLQSHVIIHKGGKMQHINMLRDKNGDVGYTTFF